MSNEITVKLKCTIEEMQTVLENKGFKQVKKYSLYDTYFIPNNLVLTELAITIKDIESGDNLIEVETVEDNGELDTIEKIVNEINNLQLPIYTDNYFIKKAEIELERMLNKR